MTTLLSQKHESLYRLAVGVHRLRRRVSWVFDPHHYARRLDPETRLPHLVKRHSSRLIKKLGRTEMRLQRNKVVNLKLCLPCINGLVIKPGEAFSFCHLVGKPTKSRGFLEGMELSYGKARSGIGGGICQLANLLHWLVLHSPLTVIERSTHSFDPFPDVNRSIPFGTGCAIFYNYVDFRFVNETEDTFQINLRMDDENLYGELQSEQRIYESYKVFEREHTFVKEGDTYFRKNEIWRRVLERNTGRFLRNDFIKRNHVRVMYLPAIIEGEREMGLAQDEL